jgi:hypothetical protein
MHCLQNAPRKRTTKTHHKNAPQKRTTKTHHKNAPQKRNVNGAMQKSICEIN